MEAAAAEAKVAAGGNDCRSPDNRIPTSRYCIRQATVVAVVVAGVAHEFAQHDIIYAARFSLWHALSLLSGETDGRRSAKQLFRPRNRYSRRLMTDECARRLRASCA